MITQPLPRQEELKSLLHYDLETGLFTWLPRELTGRTSVALNLRIANKHAGHVAAHGYLYIRFQRKLFLAHRLAWIFTYGGTIPEGYEIDHINGNPLDNRIANLRLATRSQNSANHPLRSTNRSGYKGVYLHGGGKWLAAIRVRNERIHLGSFDTKEEAGAAYLAAAEKLQREFAAHLSRAAS